MERQNSLDQDPLTSIKALSLRGALPEPILLLGRGILNAIAILFCEGSYWQLYYLYTVHVLFIVYVYSGTQLYTDLKYLNFCCAGVRLDAGK